MLRLPMNPEVAAVDDAVVGAGQAGLAAGRALQQTGLDFVIVEAASDVGGSWPDYYDSLRLFSPARFSALPGRPLPGDPARYPTTRDEITAYLRAYAQGFALPVRTHARVADVVRDGSRFRVEILDGPSVAARAVIAPSGGFGLPHVPRLSGRADYTPADLSTRPAIVALSPSPRRGWWSSAAGTARSRSLSSWPKWPRSPWRLVNRSVSSRKHRWASTCTTGHGG